MYVEHDFDEDFTVMWGTSERGERGVCVMYDVLSITGETTGKISTIMHVCTYVSTNLLERQASKIDSRQYGQDDLTIRKSRVFRP